MSEFIAVVQDNWGTLASAFLAHVRMVFISVGIGTCIAVPAGIALTRFPKVGKRVLAVMGVFQTIPSMVLFGLFMPFLGIGKTTAITVLVLYSILPILRNTYTGISEVPGELVEAAKGMGMNVMQRLFRIELPVALPVIVSGIRLSAVYIISWATVAAIIGGGGLGDLIYTGVLTYNQQLILLGAIPSSILAVTVSVLIGWIAKLVTPRGMRR